MAGMTGRRISHLMFINLVAHSAKIAVFVISACAALGAQTMSTAEAAYTRKNTFGFFAAYSNDSSHIILGTADRRKLLEIGFSYNFRLFQDRLVNVQYSGEVLPLIYESDPLSVVTDYQTEPTTATVVYPEAQSQSCATISVPYSYIDPNTGLMDSGTLVSQCVGREWTRGEGIAPVGFQWNFFPRHKTQFYLDGHGGVMSSSRPIPASTAGSFNFLFDFGGGVEYYSTHSRSWRAEMRVHHISNDYTASFNPGIDNVLFQLTFAFGK